MQAPAVIDVWRGPALESQHLGSVAVVDASGAVVLALGDISRPVFPRSAIKVMQALPLVADGAADALGLSDDELALACASHNGEPAHADTAAAMLAKAGVDAQALACGAHWPMREATARELAARQAQPSPLHNNCSGKHAGFVCVACLMAAGSGDAGRAEPGALRGFLSGYVQPEHPLMQRVGAAIATATGQDLAQAPRGTDGCSIPTYALPLRAIAHGFARVATGVGLDADHAHAAQRLRQAVARAPFMVAGTDRFDTRVMQALGERVFCKVGAEGVYGAALPEQGLGIALKVHDGQARAAEVLMAHLIERFVPLDDTQAARMHSLSHPVLRNWRGVEVGRLRVAAAA